MRVRVRTHARTHAASPQPPSPNSYLTAPDP